MIVFRIKQFYIVRQKQLRKLT